MTGKPNEQRAVFGAGCFWGVESTFRKIPGVIDVAAGYAGGTTTRPTYEDVCLGTTGHAEVVEILFDADEVDFEALLDAFFESHDPTQLDRQGPDIGAQYRSVIFALTAEQRDLARARISELDRSGRFHRPIATTIEPVAPFWRAEEYHQQYLIKRGVASCRLA